MGVLAELSSDQLGTCQHVGPLVIAAELEVAAVILEQFVEIICLHQHVIELKECESLFHPLLVAFRPQHVIYRKMRTHLAQELNIVEVEQPVSVVDHEGFAVREIDKAAHLLLKTVDIVLDRLLCEHLAKIRSAGRITDHACAAAEKGDRLVAGHLQPLHEAERHKVSYMKAVRCGIETDIESSLSGINEFPDLLFICHLRDQAARLQFFINLHYLLLLLKILPAVRQEKSLFIKRHHSHSAYASCSCRAVALCRCLRVSIS